jgi:peroxiredoxin
MKQRLVSPFVLSLVLAAPVLAARAGADEARAGEEKPPAPEIHAPEVAAPEIGARIEPFLLRDTAGESHDLARAEAKAIVLAFTGVGCPIAEQHARRIEELRERYSERGVRVFGINSSRQDTVEELRSFAAELGLRFPLLKDHDHAVADRLGARRTAEVFLLDPSLRLRYRGRVDDQHAITDRSVGLRKERPEKEYLAAAIEAVLAGRDVEPRETEPLGCVIGRARKARPDATVVFHRDVEPIVQKRCQPCHREGQIAPFPLMTYEDAAGWSGMIAEVVENRRMPPWHASREHGKFANDRSLDDGEIATILAWVEGGAPRGDPADRPPPAAFPEEWSIGEPDAIFEMPIDFQVPATGVVDYQYFIVQTRFEEDRWVESMEVKPGAREAVHHILVFAIDPKDPKRWRQETQGGVRGYFGAMVPGERPAVFGDGAAKRLPAGATLVFQVHYTTNGRPHADRSRVGLVFAKKPITKEVRTRSAHNTRFVIPAEAGRHEVTARYTFREDLKVLSFLPHMHIRGEAFRYEAHYPSRVKVSQAPPASSFSDSVSRRLSYEEEGGFLVWRGALDGDAYEALARAYTAPEDRKAIDRLRAEARSEILLDVPRYDFGWQSTYLLAEPKLMPRGTILECTATYNNSASNPALTREKWSEPVRWGDQTWEEMLIGYFDSIEAGSS